LAAVLRTTFNAGAVLSMLTFPKVTVATLPARSITVNVCDWPAPSSLKT
jgi:hypothetical protein